MHRDNSRHRRLAPALWVSGALAALVLVLGVNGSLASWTQAVLTNSQNNVATGNAVILRETDGTNTCLSSSSTTNSYTCASVNKYGGVANPLTPGGSRNVDITFTNTGSSAASTFVLAPAACSQTPTAGATTGDLCAGGDLTVAVNCVDGATYTGTPWTDLKFAAGTPTAFAGTNATYTHTATLASNTQWTCRFTVALSSTASPIDQGITVRQQMVWTLNQ